MSKARLSTGHLGNLRKLLQRPSALMQLMVAESSSMHNVMSSINSRSSSRRFWRWQVSWLCYRKHRTCECSVRHRTANRCYR